MKTKILIAGGSGLVGSRLAQYLPKDKFDINILSRRKRANHDNVFYYKWDTESQEIDAEAFKDVTVLINLAGAGIADKRWTVKRKKEIIDSRVESIQTLEKNLKLNKVKPQLYLGASATGIYGNQGDRILTEADAIGEGYLAEVTQKWEQANHELTKIIERVCLLRIGIVLSTKGGALKELLRTSAVGMYGYFGNGKAYYSWIHIDDICGIILKMIEDSSYKGIYNLTAPDPVTIKELLKASKKAKGGFGLLMPVPEFALGLALGEMSEMLTFSTRVSPKKLLKQGYKFKFTEPTLAIKDLLEKKI